MDSPRRRSGRRSGDSGTREAILAAARRRFGEQGYDAASIRSIAAEAGVDPALVHHFYGSKERLFAAAMRLPAVPGEHIKAVLGAERERFGDEFPAHVGEILIRTVLAIWSAASIRTVFMSLLRSSATNEQAVTMLREFVTGTILAALEQALPGETGPAAPDQGQADQAAQRRYRAALVASQVVGLGFTRFVLELEPLASASTEDLVAAIGPTLQRYVMGDLSVPRQVVAE